MPLGASRGAFFGGISGPLPPAIRAPSSATWQRLSTVGGDVDCWRAGRDASVSQPDLVSSPVFMLAADGRNWIGETINGFISDINTGSVSLALNNIPNNVNDAVAANLVAGVYAIINNGSDLYLSDFPGAGFTLSKDNISTRKVTISDGGYVLSSGSSSINSPAVFNGSTWVEFSGAPLNFDKYDCCFTRNNKFIIVGYGGNAYEVDRDFQNTVQLEAQLNNGGGGNLRAIDCNKHGLCVAIDTNGFISYSTQFGEAGTWLPAPRWAGQGSGFLYDVAVSDEGYVVVANYVQGALTWAHVSDMSTWTSIVAFANSGQPAGNQEVAVAASGNTFVIGYDDGFCSISSPFTDGN